MGLCCKNQSSVFSCQGDMHISSAAFQPTLSTIFTLRCERLPENFASAGHSARYDVTGLTDEADANVKIVNQRGWTFPALEL
jgi:hypothetical protein